MTQIPLSRRMKSSKFVASLGFMLVGLACTLAFSSNSTSAHGYIEAPTSRAVLCQQGVNKDCGAIQYEPQSLEAPGNFPTAGPADGDIAGAGKFPKMNDQSADRWSKVTLKGGKNTFNWHLTARHSTAEWKYYITKKDWDVNKPLKRSDLELLATFKDGGKIPEQKVSHDVNLPTDRNGYYLVLGVWEIADTGNAFYQVIDVNLVNDGTGPIVQLPTIPGNVVSTKQTQSSITVQWSASVASAGIKQYEVYRNGALVGTTAQPSFTDGGLTANTAYAYTVRAIDNAGNKSQASPAITVRTLAENAVVLDAPSGLHAHTQTTTSISIMWAAPASSNGISQYEIYRNGAIVGTTSATMYEDKGLTPNTSYTYTVRAVDTKGNRSAASAALTAATSKETTPGEGSNLPAWDATKVYLGGDKVQYNGLEYEALYWTQNNRPDQSDAWKLLSNVILAWDSSKAYTGGTKVIYDGKTYQASWWTRGETPGKADVWKLVSES